MGTQDRKLLEENWSRLRGSMQGLQSGEKSFGIMRVAKIKTLGNMGASLSHTFRERYTPNADPLRVADNSVLLGAASAKEVIAGWHDRAPEKIRVNAVHGLEYFIGGSPGKLKSMSREEQDAYFKDALDWIKERHGEQNVLSAVVHRDETTPHMSVMTIPLDERGKLNARSFVGNKKALSDLQTDFAEKVSEQYGLRRGIKGSVARHERVQRVYGAYANEKDAVALPERARNRVLGARKESDAEWHARASEAATAQVKALMLEMLDRERVSDTKLNLANQMIEGLEELVHLSKKDLDATRTQLTDTRDTLIRLKSSLELTDKGKEANASLEAYDKLEARVLNGDLNVLKDAAGSPYRINKIAEIYDRSIPDGTELTESQGRFERVLESVIDTMANGKSPKRKDPVRVAIDTSALPRVRKVLAHVKKDGINPPLTEREERMAFRDELEGALNESELTALKLGDESVLIDILGDDHLSVKEQLQLALAYYDHADIDVGSDVRVGLIERLTDIEFSETHKNRGPIH